MAHASALRAPACFPRRPFSTGAADGSGGWYWWFGGTTFPAMKVTLNGEPKQLESNTLTVSELLDALEIQQRRGIAIARNARVVPKSQWETERIEDGDRVEVVRATQGG